MATTMTPTTLGRWQYGPIQHPRLVIVGAGEFAEIAHEYFEHDSPYTVAGFAVEREYLTRRELCGFPVVPLDEVERHFPPQAHSAFVAVTYTKLNRVRARLYQAMKAKGYGLARYVSSNAFVWHNVQVGENVFIFESNVVQHRVGISDNCILWSGNHVGHRSTILPHCYIASHVVISGYCSIGEYSFVGVNVTIADHVSVGRNCLLGAGSTILRNTPDDSLYQSQSAQASKVSSLRFYKIREDG